MTVCKHDGYSLISVALALVLMTILYIEGATYWQRFQIAHEKNQLFRLIATDLARLKLEALQKGEKKYVAASRWQSKHITLHWHGFIQQDTLVIHHSPAHLALNGYFTVQSSDGVKEKWQVGRFGQMYRNKI